MPTVDFLPFAVGGAANVEAQAAYAAETALLANGFVSGVAPSAKFNKALRQSSIMSAVLAQFIADLSGQNVVDDGTIATILANLKGVIGGRPGHTYTANDWAYLDKAGGLIIQWGTLAIGDVSSSAGIAVTLPTTFPNQNLMAIVGCQEFAAGSWNAFITTKTSSTITIAPMEWSSVVQDASANWICIGR